ncbi:hypothetical protein ACJW31_11G158100 [Castanea mollissima]
MPTMGTTHILSLLATSDSHNLNIAFLSISLPITSHVSGQEVFVCEGGDDNFTPTVSFFRLRIPICSIIIFKSSRIFSNLDGISLSNESTKAVMKFLTSLAPV